MKLFIPFAEGFEEIEALAVVDVLRRAGIKIDTVGVPNSMVTGAHGVRVSVDKRLIELNPEDYDGVVLPGGNPGYLNLGRSTSLIDMIKKLNMKGKLIAAICGAPSILAKAGILENRRATIYPGMEKELPYPRGDRVVVDQNIITSQAPGTAIEFALKIVEVLAGKPRVLALKKELVV
jgi:4-methyl-5(b-hydroxyethyl)-thiazole monophosphate biosynthesis